MTYVSTYDINSIIIIMQLQNLYYMAANTA